MPKSKKSKIKLTELKKLTKKDRESLLKAIYSSEISTQPPYSKKSEKYLLNFRLKDEDRLNKAAEIEFEEAIKNKNPYNFDNGIELSIMLIAKNLPLSDYVSQKVISILSSQIKTYTQNSPLIRPRLKGPSILKNQVRDKGIIKLIITLVNKGIPLGRNRTSTHNKSAIDIVRNKLKKYKVHQGYDSIQSKYYEYLKSKKNK